MTPNVSSPRCLPERPSAPSRVQLVRANTSSLEVSWGPSQTADTYLLQVQKYDIPAAPAAAAPASAPLPATSLPKSPVLASTTTANQAITLVPSPAAAKAPGGLAQVASGGGGGVSSPVWCHSTAVLKVAAAPGSAPGASIVTVRQAPAKPPVAVTSLPAGVRMVVPAQAGHGAVRHFPLLPTFSRFLSHVQPFLLHVLSPQEAVLR